MLCWKTSSPVFYKSVSRYKKASFPRERNLFRGLKTRLTILSEQVWNERGLARFELSEGMFMDKTNVMRVLDRAKVEYRAHFYDGSDGKIDGVSVANKVGLPVESVYKTLVTRAHDGSLLVFVIPVEKELDLKKAARAAAVKSVEMLRQSELLPLTGYVHGGCSPIGMKKSFSTYIDESAEQLLSMAVSAGKIGAQVELTPVDLLWMTGGKTANLTA